MKKAVRSFMSHYFYWVTKLLIFSELASLRESVVLAKGPWHNCARIFSYERNSEKNYYS